MPTPTNIRYPSPAKYDGNDFGSDPARFIIRTPMTDRYRRKFFPERKSAFMMIVPILSIVILSRRVLYSKGPAKGTSAHRDATKSKTSIAGISPDFGRSLLQKCLMKFQVRTHSTIHENLMC